MRRSRNAGPSLQQQGILRVAPQHTRLYKCRTMLPEFSLVIPAFNEAGLIGLRQPWRREQGGRVFNLIVRLATGLPFWDTQCGFKAFRLDVFRPILQAAKSDGFGFDVELLYRAREAHLRMKEIPVRWNHN